MILNAFIHRSPAKFAALLLTLCIVMVSGTAFASGALSKLKGDIVVSTKRFPSRFDSDAEMAKHMRKVNTHELHAKENGEWEFEYMAFLPKPVATLQAAISFYDITTPGQQSLVDTFMFYPSDKTQAILNGHARLGSKFQKNRKYLMVFSRGYGQSALAKTQIVLR